MIRCYLDNVLVTDPRGWDKIISSIKRDSSVNGVLRFQDAELGFTGDGYDYLVDKIYNDGFCERVQIEIMENCSGNWIPLFRGYIFLTSATIDELSCICTVKLEDNSFYAKINNNKSIPVSAKAEQSKNGVAIDAAIGYAMLINDTDNTSTAKRIFTYRVFEVFKQMVAYLTDNEVEFVSDTFDYGGEWEGLVITDGFRVSSVSPTDYGANTTPLPFITFTDLIKEVSRKIPLAFIIENPYTSPVFRLETLDYFYTGTRTIEFANIDKIKTSVDNSMLYALVNLGSSTTDTNVALAFPEDIDYFGFKDESFHTTGTCNIDRTLDLKSNWIISSNVIQDTWFTPNDAYNDKIFLIDTDVTDSVLHRGTTLNTNFLGLDPPVYYYNERLTNRAVAERNIGGLPSDIVKRFGASGGGLFRAELTSDQTYVNSGTDLFLPTGFDNEISDPGNNYDPVTDYKYTASQAGVYDFRANIQINETSGGAVALFQVLLRQYDATNALLQTKKLYTANYNSGIDTYFSTSTTGFYDIGGSTRVIMREGDYCQIEFNKVILGGGDITYIIKGGDVTYFECFNETSKGGTYNEYNSADYPIFLHEFKYPLTLDQFKQIEADPKGIFPFYMSGKQKRYGWIQELSYNPVSGIASVKLVNDKKSRDNGGTTIYT